MPNGTLDGHRLPSVELNRCSPLYPTFRADAIYLSIRLEACHCLDDFKCVSQVSYVMYRPEAKIIGMTQLQRGPREVGMTGTEAASLPFAGVNPLVHYQ